MCACALCLRKCAHTWPTLNFKHIIYAYNSNNIFQPHTFAADSNTHTHTHRGECVMQLLALVAHNNRKREHTHTHMSVMPRQQCDPRRVAPELNPFPTGVLRRIIRPKGGARTCRVCVCAYVCTCMCVDRSQCLTRIHFGVLCVNMVTVLWIVCVTPR